MAYVETLKVGAAIKDGCQTSVGEVVGKKQKRT
jgi:hypothetical protein